MGMDIHTYVITKEGEIKKKDLYTGRCSEWFNNLMGRGNAVEYSYLPTHYNVPDFAPEEIKRDEENGYFGFRYLTVKEWRDWFHEYKPYLDAGWVRKYDKWAWEVKHIDPPESYRYLECVDNPEEWVWCEFRKEWDCSDYLTEQLADMNEDDILIYYFDN